MGLLNRAGFPAVLLALSTILNVPEAVAVPEITPVVASMVNPLGSPLALKLVGLLVAAIWYVNALPWVPVAPSALVITGTGIVIVRTSVPLVIPPDAPKPLVLAIRPGVPA